RLLDHEPHGGIAATMSGEPHGRLRFKRGHETRERSTGLQGCGAWCDARGSTRFVVRGFLRDLHVVRMTLAQAGAADAHEPGPRPQLLDRGHATVPHPGPETADQLEDRGG